MARILIGNIKGPQGEQGPQGVQGPVGPQGPQGPLPPLVNNALATEAGVSALDAAMGKTLQDQITQNTQGITQLNSKFILSGDAVSVRIYNEGDSLIALNLTYANGEQYSFVLLQNRIQLNHYDGSEWTAVWSLPTTS